MSARVTCATFGCGSNSGCVNPSGCVAVKVTTMGCGYDEAPNTDGFNLQGEDIVVEHSAVRNGDDCVPLFPPTRNVTVRNGACFKCLNCGESLGCS